MTTTAENKTKPAPRAFPAGAYRIRPFAATSPIFRVGEALVASRGVGYGIDEREGTRGVSLQSTSPSPYENCETAPGRTHNDRTQTKTTKPNRRGASKQGELNAILSRMRKRTIRKCYIL
jgi:hypothetical protein